MTDILRIPYKVIRPIYERTSFHRAVVEEVQDEKLKNAYAYCRNLTRRYAKTFYMATRFLPNKKQRGIFAIYGLCRYLDDLVDETENLQLNYREVNDRIKNWKRRLREVYKGKFIDDPILFAFSDVLRNYKIPIDLPFELMDGVCMDLNINRYETFTGLREYCYKVASTVGLMTSEIFGYHQPKALQYAIDLGIAMQLTNILRDVGEDLEKNRIYLPREDLKEFGVEESDLFEHRLSDSFVALMRYQINRARTFYRRSEAGIGMLEKDSRLPVYLARYNYGRILDRIEENGYNVFDFRAFLNTTEKISILPGILYKIRFNSP